jgi:hypothetical protein
MKAEAACLWQPDWAQSVRKPRQVGTAKCFEIVILLTQGVGQFPALRLRKRTHRRLMGAV